MPARQSKSSQRGDMKDWPQTVTELTAHLRNLRGGAPEVMKAFSNIANAALATKALDGKTKELIALGISVAIRCDDCIAFHAKAALKQGANRERQYASAFHAELQHVGSMANLLLSPNRIYFEIDNSAAISIFYN